MGFTEATLQDHVSTDHVDSSIEVVSNHHPNFSVASTTCRMVVDPSSVYLRFQVCPVCASLPGGDPNHVTDDFAAHLALEHRTPRDFISFYTFT